MKKGLVFLLLLLLIPTFFGCSTDNPEPGQIEKQENKEIEIAWSIDKDNILGPYSPFPLVTKSSFISVDSVAYPDNHLVTLISLAPNELRAYPNAFIAKYEVINNEYGTSKYALSHCPITGSTICFDRIIEGNTLTLKASGYLFNDNLMPIDIETGSIWSQMLIRGVRGTHDLKFPHTLNIVETDWRTVKTHFPKAKVYHEFVENAEIGVDIETEPTNRDFYRYGILSGINTIIVHTFNYDLFRGEGLQLKTTVITGKKVLVVGNEDLNFISSYFVDGKVNYFVDSSHPFHFKDDSGNTYNAMGLVVDGPDKNLQLASPKAYTAAWAAWQDFFDNFKIYE